MSPRHGDDSPELLLMAGDDRFSELVRAELRGRGIRFAELDPGRVPGTVVPTLVVSGQCTAGAITYEGFGRIRREFLARYDAAAGGAPLTGSPAAHARPAAATR